MKREDLALDAWELMGGEIRWDALPVIVEHLGVDDVGLLIIHLTTIRDHVARLAAAANG